MRSIIIWGPPRGKPDRVGRLDRSGKGLLKPCAPSPRPRQIKASKPRTENPQCLPDLYLLAFYGCLCPSLGLSFTVCTMGERRDARDWKCPSDGESKPGLLYSSEGRKHGSGAGKCSLPSAACQRWLKARREDGRISGQPWPAAPTRSWRATG